MRRAPTCRPVSLLSLLAFTALLFPLQAEGQSRIPGLTVTVAGAYSVDGDLTPGLTGVNTVLEPGWGAGLQLEHYAGSGLLGIRIGGTYTTRVLDGGTDEYTLIGADLGGMIRPPLLGDIARPYVALTLGAVMYQAAEGAPAFGDGEFGPDPVIRGNVTPSIGLDISIIRWLGLRLEVGDRITLPSIGFSPPTDGFPVVHTPVALAGLQYRFGVSAQRLPARRRQPPPEPEPEPEVEPEPEPEPEMEPEPEPAAAPAGFTVQVGTYLTPGTARRWGERLARRGIPVWYIDGQLGGTDVARLRAGAVASEADARQLADIISASFGWDTSIEPIGGDDSVPADAMAQTQEFLEQR